MNVKKRLKRLEKNTSESVHILPPIYHYELRSDGVYDMNGKPCEKELAEHERAVSDIMEQNNITDPADMPITFIELVRTPDKSKDL